MCGYTFDMVGFLTGAKLGEGIFQDVEPLLQWQSPTTIQSP